MGAAAAALTSAAEKAQGDRCELDGTLFFGMLSFGEYTKHSCSETYLQVGLWADRNGCYRGHQFGGLRDFHDQ
jgi:hypothetical protein